MQASLSFYRERDFSPLRIRNSKTWSYKKVLYVKVLFKKENSSQNHIALSSCMFCSEPVTKCVFTKPASINKIMVPCTIALNRSMGDLLYNIYLWRVLSSHAYALRCPAQTEGQALMVAQGVALLQSLGATDAFLRWEVSLGTPLSSAKYYCALPGGTIPMCFSA